MPYTKEEIEDKLRKALDASYVVRFETCLFQLLSVGMAGVAGLLYAKLRQYFTN